MKSKYKKNIEKIKVLLDGVKRSQLPEVIFVKGSYELGEFFEVNGKLMNDVEILEGIERWDSYHIPVIIEDFTQRSVERGKILYFPSEADLYAYYRSKQGKEESYQIISKEQWLELIKDFTDT